MGDLFFDVAERIGARLVEQAQWSGDQCTWIVRTEDPAAPGTKRAITKVAGGEVYQGSAGIALFLMELARLAGDPAIRRTALGAMRYAIDWAAAPRALPFGFHAGIVGVAHAAARYTAITGDDALLRYACALLTPLSGQGSTDRGIDALSGAGGAIGPLLQLSDALRSDVPRALAVELGDRLIATAQRGVAGWSWSAWGVTGQTRDLTGLAHGAAGIGTGLLELYAATGDGAYRYAAEQAFAYEASAFDSRARNWYDYREVEVAYYISQAKPIDELRARIASGDPTLRSGLSSMIAWCHGAPGIGLTRLRAYQLLGFARYREEALHALATTAAPETVGEANFSLCHGVSGNAELLLLASEVLGDRRWRDRAESWAEEGRSRWYDTEAWPSGTLNAGPDPSLMLGEAGTGYFFLRLAVSDMPSVLLVPGTGTPQWGEPVNERYTALLNGDMARFYGRTAGALERLGVNPAALRPDANALEGAGAVARAGQAIDAAIAQSDSTRRALLDDAALVERAQAALSLEPVDSADWWLETFDRVAAEALDWDIARFVLVPRARLVRSRHAWDAWLASGASDDQPEPEPEVWLVVRQVGGVYSVRLPALAALVLGALVRPATAREVTQSLATAAGERADDPRLLDAVRRQLAAAYSGQIVRAV